MSKALEIASERFAKGEITKEEFEEIKAVLAPSEPAPDVKPEPDASSALASEPPKSEWPPRAELPAGVATAALPPSRPRAAQSTAHQGEARLAQKPAASIILPTSYYDISGLSTALEWLIKITGVATLLSAISIQAQSGLSAKYNWTLALDTNLALLLLIGLPSLATTIVFLYWKKKSTDNLFLFKGPQSVTPAGAIYWYFVPIAWFWKPYEAMRNLVVGFNAKDEDRVFLRLWWGSFWLAGVISITAGLFLPEGTASRSEAADFVNWSIAATYLEALWLGFSYFLVQTVSEAQRDEIAFAQETAQ